MSWVTKLKKSETFVDQTFPLVSFSDDLENSLNKSEFQDSGTSGLIFTEEVK